MLLCFLFLFILLANHKTLSVCAVSKHPAFISPIVSHCGSISQLRTFSKVEVEDDELFDAEEAAAFDAHDVSDAGIEAAAMERAVMMAKELTDAKRLVREATDHEANVSAEKASAKAKEATEKAMGHLRVADEHFGNFKVAEKAYQNLENLIQVAAKAEKDDLGSLEHVFSEEDVADLAVLMLENAHTAAAEKILETEEKVSAAAATLQAAIGENQMAKAMASRAAADAKAADDRAAFTEEFGGMEEITERRRDSSVSHAAHHIKDDANRAARLAAATMRNALEDEKKAMKELETLKRNEAELKADLQELHGIIVEKATEDWKKMKKYGRK